MRHMPGADKVPGAAIPAAENKGQFVALPSEAPSVAGQAAIEKGVILNVSVTEDGLGRESVSRLAAQRFRYDANYEVISIEPAGRWLRDGGFPLTEETTGFEDICDPDIPGKCIDLPEITAIVQSATVCIARSAAYVRPHVDRLVPSSRGRPWICSIEDLGSDVLRSGCVASATVGDRTDHDECVGNHCANSSELMTLLRNRLADDTTVLASLIRNASRKEWSVRISRERPNVRHHLHARGYSWDPARFAWCRTVNDRETEEDG